MVQIENRQIQIEKIEYSPDFEEFRKSYDLFEKERLFDKRFKTVEERTLKILKEDSYARKEKWWLLIRYWCQAGYIKLVVPKEKLYEINSPESVFRIQRKLITKAKNGDETLKLLIKDKELLNKNELLNQESREVWGFKSSLNHNSNQALILK
jgi:hypothetical protein